MAGLGKARQGEDFNSVKLGWETFYLIEARQDLARRGKARSGVAERGKV